MNRVGGFTLTELLIVVALMAILAAIAVPWYTSYGVRSYRTEAMADLLLCAQGMQRHNSIAFSYLDGVDTNADGIGDADTGPVSANLCTPISARYNLRVQAATVAGFTLRATPQAGPNDPDGMLEVDATGARRWDRTDDGDFGDTGETSWNE